MMQQSESTLTEEFCCDNDSEWQRGLRLNSTRDVVNNATKPSPKARFVAKLFIHIVDSPAGHKKGGPGVCLPNGESTVKK